MIATAAPPDVPPGVDPAAPVIVVDRLVKRYKGADRNAVDSISFSVRPGELFALLGPNGAGKTTTISILTTTLAPTGGSVTIAGHDVVTAAAAVREDIGIIFQKPSLDLNLTAEENVRFHAVLYGSFPFRPTFTTMPRAYRERVREVAAVVGMEGELFKPVKTFSRGMKRKLEIARSLLHRPRVLFLDEPTAGLDPASRRAVWEYLDRARREFGTTIFLTTHYLEEAEQANSICILKGGNIVSRGSPAQVKADLVDESLLIDAFDRAALRRELTALGIPFTESTGFRIPFVDAAAAQALIRRIETPLSVLAVNTPTLEDAYLHIIGTME